MKEVKILDMMTTTMGDDESMIRTLDTFQKLGNSSSCPTAVQGYLGIGFLMALNRLPGCCSKEKTFTAIIHATAVGLANVYGMFSPEEQTDATKTLLAKIDEYITLRNNMKPDDVPAEGLTRH